MSKEETPKDLENLFRKSPEWSRIIVGSSEEKGKRPYMEDRHSIVRDINLVLEHSQQLPKKLSYFAVYDGHGGSVTSSYCKQMLARSLVRQSTFPSDITTTILNGVEDFDKELEDHHGKAVYDDGSTAVLVFLDEDTGHLWAGNTGDSRAIVRYREGIVEALTSDHKPSRIDETHRIIQSGGIIDRARFCGIQMGPMRVYTRDRRGGLSLSRSVGDFYLKYPDPLVLVTPEVTELQWRDRDVHFLLVASDGLWDAFSDAAAASFVLERLEKNVDPDDICSQIIVDAMNRSFDNITVILVIFPEDKADPRSPMDDEDENDDDDDEDDSRSSQDSPSKDGPLTDSP